MFPNRAHKNLAPLVNEQRDFKQALRHHRAAVEYNPLDVDARNDFAIALLKVASLERLREPD